MDLLLNNILNLSEEEINNSKIEFNMQAGSGGQSFLDRWLKKQKVKNHLELAKNVLIGDGLEPEEIFIQDRLFLAFQE